tara:strand:+ start:242 stop:628 length:387 start_codon:yes stop_codon:yes gene_type:complete
MAKVKSERRRAINCKLLRQSNTHNGYYKYLVTIKEKDGTINKQPAYGTDMQDAISRLVWNERTIKIEKKLENNPLLFFLCWMAIMAIPVLWNDFIYSPWFILYMFASFTALFAITGLWQHYLEKGKRK